jgi:hypothetical protein
MVVPVQWMAGIIQHTWTFALVYTLLLYLWLFGVLETVVVVIHRDKLVAGAALTIPYLITLGLTVAAALAGLADWRRRRPPRQGGGATMPGWVRTLQIIFVVAVAFIAAVVLYGPKTAMNARYFPQPLTSFTLDALGVFYLSLSLSVLFMIRQRGIATLVTYLRGAIGLVTIIVIATLLNIGIFHFSAHPRHIVYLATYVVVMIGTVVILGWDRRVTSRVARPAGLPASAPSWPAQPAPAAWR